MRSYLRKVVHRSERPEGHARATLRTLMLLIPGATTRMRGAYETGGVFETGPHVPRNAQIFPGYSVQPQREKTRTVYKIVYSGLTGKPEILFVCLKNWSGREDLNLRPPGPEPGALPG